MLLRSVALTCAMCAWIETFSMDWIDNEVWVAPHTGRVD